MILERAFSIKDFQLNSVGKNIEGSYTEIDGEQWYKISNYDEMSPFFMTIVSHADHWMFISSNGGLSAGRKNPDHALFPYCTDDVIHDSSEITGSKSIFQIIREDKQFVWEPFSIRNQGLYRIERNIYKHYSGNAILFEEKNLDLEISFKYAWHFSEKYGFVKKSELSNNGKTICQINVLDGMQNILPYGVDSKLQLNYSTLVDAYKKNELDAANGIGLYMLSAIITDKATPSESLKATTIWQTGLSDEKVLLSSNQLGRFREGLDVYQEDDIRATRGAYFVNSFLELVPDQIKKWHFIAELNQDASDVAFLRNMRSTEPDGLVSDLLSDIELSKTKLLAMIGKADGLQSTADRLSSNRHLSNVLFNIMRGGIFEDQYEISRYDFVDFVKLANIKVHDENKSLLEFLPATVMYDELLDLAQSSKDNDLIRLVYEYLPLTFSRRHGDPSRPWNQFSIEVQHDDGSRNRNFEGNWRDIFQNWEALAQSYPSYIESMIAKFVNASTVDGYNPYRITRSGIDWETIEPDNPWSFIGYWGDHQIIYLLKLLEISKKHHPGKLESLLTKKIFSYANVPYRIKKYNAIVNNPQDTICFSDDLQEVTTKRVSKVGSDGKLVWSKDGDILKVSLIEKLLLTLLTKISNFVPEAGIWLNTQRPEWNDANNALVGNGTSMVTLYYLRRYINTLLELLSESESYVISEEIANFHFDLLSAMQGSFRHLSQDSFTEHERKTFVDTLGKIGEQYREKVYSGFNERGAYITADSLSLFCELSIKYIDHSIKANKRSDGLYHAYNLISLKKDAIHIDHLYEMLEGQVAVLTSGFLSPEEALDVLYALKSSAIFREEHYSYMLYPDRELKRFLEKNNIPESFAAQSSLFETLVKDGNTDLIKQDVEGVFHFNGTFNNSSSVQEALQVLCKKGYKKLVDTERDSIMAVFEQMFDHYSFTGRSGTFYGYEGLGSIYWHMVSKLVLAIAENYRWAKSKGASKAVLSSFMDFYYETRAGIGLNKTPELYGAFPTDPYSHTPGNAGAQQPGMTGQVKEDVICRWFELGIFVENGTIKFDPFLLRPEEFSPESSVFSYYAVEGKWNEVELKPKSLAYTYCQIPIVYSISTQTKITVLFLDGRTFEIDSNVIPREIASHIFQRTGQVAHVICEFSA